LDIPSIPVAQVKEIQYYKDFDRLRGTMGWSRTTKAVTTCFGLTETWKTALAANPVSSSNSVGECKEKVRTRCWYRLATNSNPRSFVAPAQASGDGRRWPLVTLQKGESKWI